jgi:hypothetical protein
MTHNNDTLALAIMVTQQSRTISIHVVLPKVAKASKAVSMACYHH